MAEKEAQELPSKGSELAISEAAVSKPVSSAEKVRKWGRNGQKWGSKSSDGEEVEKGRELSWIHLV